MSRWIWSFLALLFVLALALLGLPTFVGSHWVYQPLVDRLAAEKFQLKIEKVHFRWFQPISFKTIQLSNTPKKRNPKDQLTSASDEAPLVKIDSIRSDRSLLGFLWYGRNLGTIEVINPNIDVRLLEDGSNLERLIGELTNSSPKTDAGDQGPDGDQGSKQPPMMDITIVVKGFHVSVTDEQTQEPIMVIPPFDTSISYKSIGTDPQVMVAPTKALSQVVITRRLIQLGLAKAVPLLANSTEFDGQVSLECGPMSIPLEHPQDATGTAALTLHSVRTIPADPTILGAIDLMGRLFKRQLPHELIFVDGSTVNVEIANQVVKHEGVRAGLPKVDQRLQIATSGSVGLVDRKLDLSVELPVPLEHLAKRQTVKQLGVPSIILPIKGSLDKPELDWSTLRQNSADLLSVISTALGEEAPLAGAVTGALSDLAEGQADQAIEQGINLVQQILQRRKQQSQSQPDNPSDPMNESSSEKSGRPLRDAIKKIFRDR